MSRSEDDTRAVGSRLARRLRGGELIGLHGDLGAGKTVFVRGLADGLGVDPGKVRSPTFTLINEYSGGRLPLYHIDLYRLAPSETDRLALREWIVRTRARCDIIACYQTFPDTLTAPVKSQTDPYRRGG